MNSRQANRPGLLSGAYPDRSCAADQRKRIVADQFRRSLELEDYRIVRIGADRTELVGNSQDDASRIRTIGDEGSVVRQQHEFSVDATARHRLGDDLLALQIAVDAQIAPSTNLSSI